MNFLSRIRLLPVTIFAASLMLTVKIGNIWEDLDGLWNEVVNVAGAQAQQPQANAPEGGQPPAEGAAPKAAEAGAAAPGGARPKPSIALTDPTLLTQAEIDLLQQLAERRQELDARQRELEVRAGILKAAESRIDKKIEELQTLETTINGLVAEYDQQQNAKIASLVKIYENMKPKDAARIFEELDMDTLLLVAERMKERSLAPVLASMNPAKARDVTVDLARRRQLPQAAAAGG